MSIDLKQLFALDVSALQLVVRTSVVYIVLLVAIRLISRREMGSFELPDLLMIVLISDGVQNGMAGNYTSVSGALVVAGTLIGMNYLLDFLTFRWSIARRLLTPPPLKLVENGQILHRNLRREMISVEELESQLRLHEVEDVAEVRTAYFEPDGHLSVFTYKDGRERSDQHRTSPAH